jgi:hypothetical protein
VFIVDEVSLLKAMIVSLSLTDCPNRIGQSSAAHAKAIGAWDVFFGDVNADLVGSK